MLASVLYILRISELSLAERSERAADLTPEEMEKMVDYFVISARMLTLHRPGFFTEGSDIPDDRNSLSGRRTRPRRFYKRHILALARERLCQGFYYSAAVECSVPGL